MNAHELDAAYTPFPTFIAWQSKTTLDTGRWDRYSAALKDRGDFSPEVLRRAREVAKRAAALDTGAIEGLYDVDRGFTYTVAFEIGAWEAALAQKGEQVKSLFETQLHAYEYVLDFATKAEPISEAAIRFLHEEMCRAQDTYAVVTAVGPQQQKLPKGQYKVLPNHVRTRKGVDHSYAPADVTPAEMARLVAELRSDEFLAAHPVIQAAYAHYSFVVIHPFADGNGRVARALASAFTYRAISMPIVILSETKAAYLDALELADGGDYQAFVDFMLERSLDTIRLVEESLRSAVAIVSEQSLKAIDRLYITKGGYTQDEVDGAGRQVVQAVIDELVALRRRNKSPNVVVDIISGGPNYTVTDAAYRGALSQQLNGFVLSAKSKAPAAASAILQYCLWLPRNAGGEDDLQLRRFDDEDLFSARMSEILPEPSGILKIRATIFADRIFGELMGELKWRAEDVLRGTHSSRKIIIKN